MLWRVLPLVWLRTPFQGQDPWQLQGCYFQHLDEIAGLQFLVVVTMEEYLGVCEVWEQLVVGFCSLL